MFISVAETLKLSQTAKEFFVSAPTVTRVIQELEADVGCPLLIRDSHHAHLTSEGHMFRQFAQSTIDNYTQMKNAKSNTISNLIGTIRIFCSVTASYSILPPILGKFAHQFPDVVIELETGDVEDTFYKLEKEDADIGIGVLLEQDPHYMATKSLTHIPLSFIEPISQECKKSDWKQYPFIMPAKGKVKELTQQWLNSQGWDPRISAIVSGYEGMISLVGEGIGTAIVPEMVLEKSGLATKVTKVHGIPNLPKITSGICTLKKNRFSPIIDAFWTCADELSS